MYKCSFEKSIKTVIGTIEHDGIPFRFLLLKQFDENIGQNVSHYKV